MNPSSETLLCGCTSGAIFVRSCPYPAMTRCIRCQCPLCREHARPEPPDLAVPDPAPVRCPACYAESRRGIAEDDSDGARSVFSALSTRRHNHSASHGHSGAVVTGQYADDAGEVADHPFSSEDYEAFDAVSDYDKDAEQGDGYDS